MNWRGGWDASVAYRQDDGVSHGGSSWIALRENIGSPPAPGEDWSLIAPKGDAGEQGEPGPQGPPGPPALAGLACPLGQFVSGFDLLGAMVCGGLACAPVGTPACAIACEPGHHDLNGFAGDGCEFVLDADAIYVSVSDPNATLDPGCGLGPAGTGQSNRPCRTIAQGLVNASANGRSKVLVADGPYDEAVSLVSGMSLLGGFRADTWERHLSTTLTLLRGVSSTGNHDHAVTAIGVTAPTLFEGFVLHGPHNAKTSGNSYALYVASSDADLVVRNNVFYAGDGGPGRDQGAAPKAADGVNGGGRANNPAQYDALVAAGSGACNQSNDRQLNNGGRLSCASGVVDGGRGGGNRCPPVPGQTSSGLAGLSGGGGGSGAGGVAGEDSRLTTESGQLLCNLSGDIANINGGRGLNGAGGFHGQGGPGCASGDGTVSGGHWTGLTGSSGVGGTNGAGGGGGGAGGGGLCDGCTGGKDRLGGHGGGGASGGCGGGGSSGGTAGGGSFAIFVNGGSAPTISDNVVYRGTGGTGGHGGAGGSGGLGGRGGQGGLVTSAAFCSGTAGDGGDGGPGGHGGGGGGGCGGVSYGIYVAGFAPPGYCAGHGNVVSGGSGGSGGAGGGSLVNSGAAGLGGTLGACN
jgi:hypothetical protein